MGIPRRLHPGTVSAIRTPQSGSGRSGDWLPFVFWVIGPNLTDAVSPPLFLRVNPNEFELFYSKAKDTFQTRGGFVEQVWGEQLEQITIASSTGSFISVEGGLSAGLVTAEKQQPKRHRTIAYQQYKGLVDMYRNNGAVYGDDGSVLLNGRIRLAFDNGIYDGYFVDFTEDDNVDDPYQIRFTLNFKVERTVLNVITTTAGQVYG